MKQLTEHQKRVLTRIARQMLDSATTEVTLTLQGGAIRGYHEGRHLRPDELDAPDPDVLAELPKA